MEHFPEYLVVTVAPVAKKNCASVFHVPEHFFGATISGYFFPLFLTVFFSVLVLTVTTDASGALGSVLIGGIEQSSV